MRIFSHIILYIIKITIDILNIFDILDKYDLKGVKMNRLLNVQNKFGQYAFDVFQNKIFNFNGMVGEFDKRQIDMHLPYQGLNIIINNYYKVDSDGDEKSALVNKQLVASTFAIEYDNETEKKNNFSTILNYPIYSIDKKGKRGDNSSRMLKLPDLIRGTIVYDYVCKHVGIALERGKGRLKYFNLKDKNRNEQKEIIIRRFQKLLEQDCREKLDDVFYKTLLDDVFGKKDYEFERTLKNNIDLILQSKEKQKEGEDKYLYLKECY